MTANDFYNFAVIAAKQRGYENPSVTIVVICTSPQDGLNYVCKLWDRKKSKHIESKFHKNPLAALQSFKDAIDFENKTYSDISEDIELTS